MHSRDDGYLSGQLLIAMPGMADPRFERSVVFVCAHNAEGAMGLVVNKLFDAINFDALLKQLDIARSPNARDIQVRFGGPVEGQRGFVLHSGDYHHDGTMPVDDNISLTTTLDILGELAAGAGPRKSMLALGYAGWGPGQLEEELAENAWLHAPFDESLVFDSDIDTKWERAFRSIGVDLTTLSGAAGHA